MDECKEQSDEDATYEVASKEMRLVEYKIPILEGRDDVLNRCLIAPRAYDDQEPSAGTDRGSKRRRSGTEPASTSAPKETTTTTAGKTTPTGSKTHKQSASQSALVEESMQTTNVFEAPAHQEFEIGVHDEQEEKEEVYKPQPKNWTGSTTKAANYPLDLRQPLSFRFHNAQCTNSIWSSNDSQIRQIRPLWNITLGKKRLDSSLHLRPTRESAVSLLKKGNYCCHKVEIVDNGKTIKIRIQTLKYAASSRARKCDPISTLGVWKIFNWVLKAIKETQPQALTRKSNSEMATKHIHHTPQPSVIHIRGTRQEEQVIGQKAEARRLMRSLERFVVEDHSGLTTASTKDHMIYHMLFSS
ncbi:hypothetical protein Tco_0631759 [Tanacetum coccineum]